MEFKQLADGSPPDIEAKMNKYEAEVFQSDLESADMQETPVFTNLVNTLDEGEVVGDSITFVIPGDEAGEVAEFSHQFQEYIDSLNEKTLNEAESAEDEK